ncbi:MULTISPECIES: hypothetical protein [Bifidobacterium]|uniref:hypothetical protein n=1 Tax=Bifidobacterium TaxID=1678 RepID=UPI002647D805|nr:MULTISPECIES: hypothetical protein [Bifidobacterium]MDN5978656.1 hypothetical protein [Bifidobacterium mongoliense]MDN6016736.1 hypothetical protein [Bifidobacterium mongoliense]MDN6467722.1 hypothetical protein [Bifidobacterium crudilactis]MDN6558730.1 hypothetical protein [Bifidobacterium crudilactis]MDN6622255.1 hypothetical protein [Bifidobacterium crudilactis]
MTRRHVLKHSLEMLLILLFCMVSYAVPAILVHFLVGLLGVKLGWPVCLLVAVVLLFAPMMLFLVRELRHAWA